MRIGALFESRTMRFALAAGLYPFRRYWRGRLLLVRERLGIPEVKARRAGGYVPVRWWRVLPVKFGIGGTGTLGRVGIGARRAQRGEVLQIGGSLGAWCADVFVWQPKRGIRCWRPARRRGSLRRLTRAAGGYPVCVKRCARSFATT